MTISKVLPILTSCATDKIAMSVIDRTKLVREPAVGIANGSETVYRLVDGDTAHLSQVRVGDYPPSKAGATYNKSAKINTWRKTTNSETGEEVWSKLTATIALSDASGEGIHDPAEIAQVLGAAYTVFVPAGGVDDAPDVTALARSAYGVSDIIDLG